VPAKQSPPRRSPSQRRCLIVERHSWETGFAEEQLQIPLSIANEFFGSAHVSRSIVVRLADAPKYKYPCKVSKKYTTSGTRRINGLPFLGLLGPCFVFFQETQVAGTYDLWCQYDMPIVVARFRGWFQAKNSQYGRGRLALVLNEIVQRPIERIES
jgi:hypothetical protein